MKNTFLFLYVIFKQFNSNINKLLIIYDQLLKPIHGIQITS